jgi:hypothetical protein
MSSQGFVLAKLAGRGWVFCKIPVRRITAASYQATIYPVQRRATSTLGPFQSAWNIPGLYVVLMKSNLD